MKGQVLIISAVFASILIILFMVFLFNTQLPYTTAVRSTRSTYIDLYEFMLSSTSWNATSLVEYIVRRYGYDYVHVYIEKYNIVKGFNIGVDEALLKPVNISVDEIPREKYIFTVLYRNGEYVKYVIEVGYR